MLIRKSLMHRSLGYMLVLSWLVGLGIMPVCMAAEDNVGPESLPERTGPHHGDKPQSARASQDSARNDDEDEESEDKPSRSEIRRFARTRHALQASESGDEKGDETSADDSSDADNAPQGHLANDNIIDVIKEHGLSIERFNEIARQSRQDPEIRQQIEKAASRQ